MQYLKDVVRTRILTAAVAEFKENGFSNASIRNIAEVATISLGNIYRYYENKEDLYLTIISPLTKMVKQESISSLLNEKITLTNAMDTIVDYLLSHADEYAILRVSETVDYNHFFTRLSELMSKKIEQVFVAKDAENFGKIVNPKFCLIIATGYLNAILSIINDNKDDDVIHAYVKEISKYYFQDLITD
ncbi:MAG: TetR/AcrR family transcriptional regulator [Clostridia bacterium]